MRICLTCRSIDPEAMLEQDRAALAEARAWAAAGHDVHLIVDTLDDGVSCDDDGVTTHELLHDSPELELAAYPSQPVRRSMEVCQTLRRLHEQTPFDAIRLDLADGEPYFTLRTKRTLGVFDGCPIIVRARPTAQMLRESNGDERLSFESLYLDLIEAECLDLADALIADGQPLLDALADRRDVPDGQTRAVVPPVLESQPERRGTDGPPVSLFAGAFERRLGVFEFVDAALAVLTKSDNARVRIVGTETDTGPFGRSALDEIRKRAGGAERRIEIVESASHEQMAEALEIATVLCMPGVTPEIPEIVALAIAQAAPVVAVDGSGPAAQLNAGASGRTVPSTEPRALADGIDALLSDPDARAASDEAPTHDTVDAIGQIIAACDDTPAAETPEPLVSVIITVYNLGAYLHEAVRSVLAQTYGRIETIIVDDGSTDAFTHRVLDELERDGHRLIRKPNGGLSSARNAGIEAATGEWVVMFDADDVLGHTWIEKAVRAITRDPGLDYVSPLVVYFQESPDVPTGGWIPYGLDPSNRDLIPVLNIAGAGAASMLRRASVLEAGGYDEAWTTYEDWDLWCALAERNARGTVIPEFLLHYRIRPDSMYRTEGVSRHERLKSRMLRKHPDLITPRTLCGQFGEAVRYQKISEESRQTRASAIERMNATAEERDRLAARVESLTTRLAEQSQRADRAIQAADSLRDVEQRLRAQYEQTREQVARLSEERERLSARASQEQDRAESLNERLASSRDALVKTRATLDEMKGRREQLSETLAQLREQLADRSERLGNALAQLRTTQQQAEAAKSRTLAVRSQFDAALARHAGNVERLEAGLSETIERAEGAERERDALSQQLHAAQQQLHATQQQLHSMQQQLSEMPQIIVRDLLADNVRYRVADRVNKTLKAVGVQKPIKAIGRAISSRNGSDEPG